MLTIATFLVLGAQTAELRIAPEKTTFAPDEVPIFRVELTNHGKRALNLLDVGDGSESHWINPHVGWSVLPEGGKSKHPVATPAVLLPRCGNMNTTNEEAFRTLGPGEKASFRFAPIDFDKNKPGKYRIVYYYEVDPKDTPRLVLEQAPAFGGLPPRLLPKYRSLTPLKLVSNEVHFEIAASDAGHS